MTASIPPPSPTHQVRPHRARRSRAPVVAAIAVIGALAVAGILILLTRSPGPPGPPGAPRAAATTCGAPCTEIRPRVQVTWTAPSDGGEVTGYRVQRDGEPLPGADALDPATLVLVDDSVDLGRTYTYRVIAIGEEGSSPPSLAATAEIGLPAAGLAQLDGVYDVRLKVRSARSLAAMLGIDQPVPGKRGRAPALRGDRAIASMTGAVIAVVDDDPYAVDAMSALFETWGARVAGGSALPDVLDALGRMERYPDLVVADLRLADGNDGVQVVHRLRDELGIVVPALLVSGDTSPAAERDARVAGLPLLGKPVVPAVLHAAAVGLLTRA